MLDSRRSSFLIVIALALASQLAGRLAAEAPKAGVGVSTGPAASLLARAPGGSTWTPLPEKGVVPAEAMLLGFPGSSIDVPGVHIAFLGDLARNSELPIVESAIKLHTPSGASSADVDVTLDRGRIDLLNTKKAGPATIRLRFLKETWELVLGEPGSRVALEIYSRWPKGFGLARKKTSGQRNEDDVPTAKVVLLALSGQVTLKEASLQFVLSAPPGPAIFHWDSVAGPDSGPKRLEKLPAWAEATQLSTPEAKARAAALDLLRTRIAASSVPEAAAEFLKSDDVIQHKIAVNLLGATDELALLLDVLADRLHPDVREDGVQALRHFMGRDPSHDDLVIQQLVERRKFSKGQAWIILELLHTPDETDLNKPETYEALIEFLRHPKLAIRELAKFHLYRLASEGKDIPYDPAGTEESHELAYKAWKERVPSGSLPKLITGAKK